MIEKHPYGDFVPNKSKYLILGSFTGIIFPGYDWFYSNKRNQFWPIIEGVYGVKLTDKKQKQQLFTRLNIAITDIISSCERKANNNLDVNLTNMVFNKGIINILRSNKIETIYFSSRFVEKLFKKHFGDLILNYPKIKLITLPSPSPRFASMTKAEKITRYKEVLPKNISYIKSGS